MDMFEDFTEKHLSKSLGEPSDLTLAEHAQGLLGSGETDILEWQLERSEDLRQRLATIRNMPAPSADDQAIIRQIVDQGRLRNSCRSLASVFRPAVLAFPAPAAMAAAAAAVALPTNGGSDDGMWEWQVVEDRENGVWILVIETSDRELAEAYRVIVVSAGGVRKGLALEYDEVLEKWGGEVIFTHEEAVTFKQHARSISVAPDGGF